MKLLYICQVFIIPSIWTGGTRISKIDIIRNKDHLCQNLTKNDISQILKDVKDPDHLKNVQDIIKAETDTQSVEKFLEFIDSEDTYVDIFLEYLKKHNRGDLLRSFTRTCMLYYYVFYKYYFFYSGAIFNLFNTITKVSPDIIGNKFTFSPKTLYCLF